ncbi:MAG: RecX family transcriptional regulator [Alphaproteobacteria bacterium]|nr:RecX family transcriptional regulator [Alphaproteobacteria bacterium]
MSNTNDTTTGGPKKRRKPKPATAARLEKAALAHIDRYATSAANLRSVLMRRVERSVRLHDTDRDEASEWVDAIIAKLLERRLLDDAAYAQARANSLHRSGASRRKIAGMLHQKGVGQSDIAAALASVGSEYLDSELAAACRFARRRRLGPYRAPEARAERHRRDLAALARAGFGYDTARRVIDAESAEALEDDALALS